MIVRQFEWGEPLGVASEIRDWFPAALDAVEVDQIRQQVRSRGDAAVLELTARFDAVEQAPESLRVDPAKATSALRSLDPVLHEALELAATNIGAVAEAQLQSEPRSVTLPQGHTVEIREVAVGAAGVYAPGGRAAYPSTVLMGCIPAKVAGVGRVALATPPGPDGTPPATVLAAAALCEIEEIYAMGGAQAIFALADGTESVRPVDVIVGPGNTWVQEAKRRVYGTVGVDSFAGPSELMIVAAHDTEVEWAALDLCAQAEHGADGLLVVAAVEQAALDSIASATERVAAERPSVGDAPIALVQVPDLADAIALANALAPEHLQLMSEDAYALAGQVSTAGCVFVGRASATAFGDYAAGSNHVLPTGGAGRFSGPLGPGVFRRAIANVSFPGSAAAALAPHVVAFAEAEGFPVHGESARVRQ